MNSEGREAEKKKKREGCIRFPMKEDEIRFVQ